MKGLKIGILGGGQLGRMTCLAAKKLGFEVLTFADQKDSPASFVCDKTIVADFTDKKALENFAKAVDVVTFEFENIPLETVEFVEEKVATYPNSNVLKIAQNRLFEKGFLNGCGIGTAPFVEIRSKDELLKGFDEIGKSVLKTATMGYDGKGQFVIASREDAVLAWDEIEEKGLLKNKLILEGFCPFESEISVVVARSVDGEVACYEPLTNIHKDGILDKSIYPAKVSKECAASAVEIGKKIALEIGLVGVLAIEFFVMEGGKLLVNEMAPRPHNSGHFSMDGCRFSQFDQLVRILNGGAPESVEFLFEGFMKNLVGDEVLDLAGFKEGGKGVYVHLYDKKEVKKGRKMGHVNVVEKEV